MRNLLNKLRKLNEEMNAINLETFRDACLSTSKFFYDGEDLAQMLEDGEQVAIQEYIVDTGEVVFSVDYENIYICDADTFNEIIDSCAREYRFKYINDFLEPFFDDNAYYKACRSDKLLTKLILEYDDIKEWESAKVNNIEYVIFK
jgi:hypothetical protein